MLTRKRGKLARRRGTTTLGVLAVAGLLTAFGPSLATAATPQKGQVGKWQQAMAKLKVPGKGCFTASYPKVGWARTTCKKAPHHPYPPVHGPQPQAVGNGVDISALVTGQLTSATGSFGSVSPGIAETGQQNGHGPQVANTFSLQLNTKPFSSPACSGSPNPGCQGWEQFVYSTTSNDVFVQYWLLRYNRTCPAGWNTFHFDPPDSDTYCWRNSTSSPLTSAALTAAGLTGTMLTGSAASGGNDTVAMTTASGHGTATGADSLLHLAGRWQEVEFAVVGDCCSTQANFNAGAALNVRTTVHSGTRMAPPGRCLPALGRVQGGRRYACQRSAAGLQADANGDRAVAKIQRMGVPLRSIADDRDFFGLNQRQVRGVVVIKLCHSFVSSRCKVASSGHGPRCEGPCVSGCSSARLKSLRAGFGVATQISKDF